MKRALLVLASAGGLLALGAITVPATAQAAACAAGVYRAGCVGPHGAVVAHRPPPAYYHRPPAYYHRPPVHYNRPPAVACGAGPYRAGCVRRY
jgi:hypothetical protein